MMHSGDLDPLTELGKRLLATSWAVYLREFRILSAAQAPPCFGVSPLWGKGPDAGGLKVHA